MATTLDNKTPLGKIILKNLYLKGKNQAWLAQQIHVKPSHICILCSRTTCPNAETLLKISKALDIDVRELYNAVAETVGNKSK
jgi:plasmid maintenance system antidote protein VapI